MDPLTRWLHVTNKFIKKTDTVEVTHLMLNGGCLNIKEEYALFIKL